MSRFSLLVIPSITGPTTFRKTIQSILSLNLLRNVRNSTTPYASASRNLVGMIDIAEKKHSDHIKANRKVGVRVFSVFAMEDPRLKDFFGFLDSLKNYEKEGVPKGAGTDTDEGFDLRRMERLVQLLGNPLSRYPVVHIAGTKGKGSTSAFIGSILREGGYSVGLYTSPHLKTIRERIVSGRKAEIISVENLQNLFQDVQDILNKALQTEHLSLTHFEVMTALAFKYFAQQGVDIAVVEAGLGGARDATNVIHSKGLSMSVITTIGMEHMDALGGSLESIAISKSGIIKEGCPVILGGPFEPRIEYILRKTAASMNAPVTSAFGPGINSTITKLDSTSDQPCQYADILVKLDENDPQTTIELFGVRLRMIGYHQLQNAVTAVCIALCLRSQGWRISSDSIRAGLENTNLYGRCQFLTPKQVEMLGISGATVVLDGAHTEASAKALATTIRMLYPDKLLAFVIAMANDKDHSSFADHLISGARPNVAIFTEVSVAGGNIRTTPASSLLSTWMHIAQGHNFLVTEMAEKQIYNLPDDFSDPNSQRTFPDKPCLLVAKEPDFVEAVKRAGNLLKLLNNECSGIICVTGSLHLVSTVISHLHD
ncbi:dihydrofolate synthetase isoform X1 [Cryptomeria japonica]|uniref:dihydrofolate synthetase isoform X1 n=2 Tax=Cryptomeria japonica TaxID=3369 RepID=UPI0027DA9C2D|nr:dihydrofolate synthetase isoform X1 [Cryptomeria japonica]